MSFDALNLERKSLNNPIMTTDFDAGAVDISYPALTYTATIPAGGSITLLGTNNGCTFTNKAHYRTNYSSKLQPTTKLSVAFTVKMNSLSTANGDVNVIIRRGNTGGLVRYYVLFNNRGGNYEFITYAQGTSGAARYIYTGHGNLNANTHFVCVFDAAFGINNFWKVYKNGVFISPAARPINNFVGSFQNDTSNLLYFGGADLQYAGTLTTTYNMTLNKLIVSKDAWTSDEALNIYNNWRG